ncbi:protein required for some forms of polarized growth, localized to sites of polarized growth [Scheffersomyces xylosifermentans]|uniref:protein required for some forms of polarized growth, localized to sites of polarized growth n=1 Tax=Scheffersomyces xylosifermentans TaxID=1304137 RepID=UPI00315D7101
MIDPDAFKKSSPFRNTHNDSASNYNLSNTTSDLLKFQLQEQFRSKLMELNSESNSKGRPPSTQDLNFLNNPVLQDSFNSHLQSSINDGNVSIRNDSSYSSLSLSTAPSSVEDETFEMESFIDKNANTHNYLNLKVLIENSIFDTSKINKDAILSLSSLKSLKNAISESKEKQRYLLSKITLAQQFIADIVMEDLHNSGENSDINSTSSNPVDAKLIIKILKSTGSLQDQLININTHLETLTTKLNNHNLACLVLGYVEDVKLSTSGNAFEEHLRSNRQSNNNITGASSPLTSPGRANVNDNDSLLKSFDSMLSHIVSIAAQRNVTLPSPPTAQDSLDNRTKWAQKCIDEILLQSQPISENNISVLASETEFPTQAENGSTTINNNNNLVKNGRFSTSTSSTNNTPSKKADYSLLNDTSFFSNSSFSPSKTVNEKMISEYKTALNDLRFSYQYLSKEYELSRESSSKLIQDYRKKINALEKEQHKNKNHSRASQSSSSDSNNSEIIMNKDKEIAKLRRELNELRVDRLGMRTGNGSSYSLASPKMSHDTSHLQTQVSPITGESLQVPHDTLSEDEDISRPVSASYSGMSNAILRKEFKKIVNNIQDQYEVELSEERLKRRQLQMEVQSLKNSD